MPDSAAAHAPSTVAEPLVAPEWLAHRLADPSLLILDIRSVVDGGGRKAYEAGHIPGAIHSDYVNDAGASPRGWRPASSPIAPRSPTCSAASGSRRIVMPSSCRPE